MGRLASVKIAFWVITSQENEMRTPALDLSEIVRYPCTVINSIVVRKLAARSPELLGAPVKVQEM